ncbi:BBP7 family outer membrane beta-barrel protein [Adhaeretor mobilis]|uniref:Uncharacterized protein n=1 Tax=Adhaeretor mobilis TaxID=1930276 RepID=A0A517MYX3_9BACT|nr:BBP7 family outer membrane beta-barrel protein [Adhaeretor mobilis]QDT00083.1 hypothetical protein HG15A2_34180 [Adhaeretor mobilis]
MLVLHQLIAVRRMATSLLTHRVHLLLLLVGIGQTTAHGQEEVYLNEDQPAGPLAVEASLADETFQPYGSYESACSGCSEGACAGGCSRCGCNTQYFHWIKGPGNCDEWCLGPHWEVEASGLMLYREDADWSRVTADVGVAPEFISQFDHSPGARVFATAYNEHGYGLQIGYEGVGAWNSRAEYDLGGATRSFDYQTSLNSIEINFLTQRPSTWKFFAGFRYVELDEDFRDFTANDIANPAPADPAAAPFATIDNGQDFILENRLIGFQLGGLRDTWQVNSRFTLEPFANAGVYCNMFKRADITRTVTTITAGDDLSTPLVNEFSQSSSESRSTVRRDFAEAAFLGELGLTAQLRINRCLALTSGYQVLFVDGVGEGLDAAFSPDLISTSLVYHGLQFGLEYRR